MDSRNKKRTIGHHISKMMTRIEMPWAVVAVLVIIVVGLFVMGTGLPSQVGGNKDIVDQKMTRFIELYLGFVNVSITNKTLSDKVWTVSALAHAPDGLVSLDMRMDAETFSVLGISQSITVPTKPNTIVFLNKDVGCSVGDVITADIYIDPYDPWTIKYDSVFNSFLARFGGKVRAAYRIVPTYSFDDMRNANSTAVYALRYLECAKDTPYFQAVKQCIFSRYNQTQTFLTENDTLSCVSNAGMDAKAAFDCANGDQAISALSVDERFAETFLGSPTTPAVVFDCRYKTYPLFMENAFCYLYPKMDACKEN